MTEKDLNEMATNGFLQSKDILDWKSGVEHDVPMPDEEDIIVFKCFFLHSFRIPSCAFFSRTSFLLRIELVILNPNSVLHITILVHLYKAYLGIPLHFAMFCYLYQLKPQLNKQDMRVVGGAGFQLHPNMVYLVIPLKSS